MTWPVTATFEDGHEETFDSMDSVPVEQVRELRGPAVHGEAVVLANLANGETAHRCQTQVKRIGSDETLSIPTFSIFRHGQPLARLYIRPDGTPVLTTEELLWP